MLAKFNRIMRKIGMPINILNILVGLLIGIAHVYLPFTSLFGLFMGIVMALSGSVSMGISYWFTSKNSQTHNAATTQVERPPLENTRASNIFMGFALPMLLLNTASSFFGMYTGTLLLAAALSFAISPPATIAIALVLSTVMAVGTLINSWLQTHYVWESLKKPAVPAAASQETPSVTKQDAATQTEDYEAKVTLEAKATLSPGTVSRSASRQPQAKRTALSSLFEPQRQHPRSLPRQAAEISASSLGIELVNLTNKQPRR